MYAREVSGSWAHCWCCSSMATAGGGRKRRGCLPFGRSPRGCDLVRLTEVVKAPTALTQAGVAARTWTQGCRRRYAGAGGLEGVTGGSASYSAATSTSGSAAAAEGGGLVLRICFFCGVPGCGAFSTSARATATRTASTAERTAAATAASGVAQPKAPRAGATGMGEQGRDAETDLAVGR